MTLYRHLVSCGSTNDEARNWAEDGALHGSVVWADQQQRGRGRGDHTWHSASDGGLYCSFVVRPRLQPSQAPLLSFVAAVAVYDALSPLLQTPLGLKWPNDILSHTKHKLGGLLLEMSCSQDKLDFVIVGIGINVNQEEFPEEIREIATSMRRLSGQQFAREDVLMRIQQQLLSDTALLCHEGFAPIRARWKQHSYTLGNRVRSMQGNARLEGIAVDLEMDGALLLQADDGALHRIIAGDLHILS